MSAPCCAVNRFKCHVSSAAFCNVHDHRLRRRRVSSSLSRLRRASGAAEARTAVEVDVAIIGAGVIGLCAAHTLLSSVPGLSVALLDSAQPCAGATGAGQGYIWLAHRDPVTGPASWALAQAGKRSWEVMAASGGTLADALEWQALGSLLLAGSEDEASQLASRAAMLEQAGVAGVRVVGEDDLRRLEPALALPGRAAGLLVESDAQLNGRAAAFALLGACEALGAAGRFRALLHEGVERLEPGPAGCGSEPPSVVTRAHRVNARRAVILSAGVWSGGLLSDLTGDRAWGGLFQPRRGHLLELAPPQGMPPLHRAVMELSYSRHYSSGSAYAHSGDESAVDVTFTATTSVAGSLLVGSSREFSGWQATPAPAIIHAILRRAALFLPALSEVALDGGAAVRVGLRPYAVGGLPAVGPVDGIPGLLLAAGHEGSGLCMAPATAALLLHYAGLAEGQPKASGVSLLGKELAAQCGDLLPHVRRRAVPA